MPDSPPTTDRSATRYDWLSGFDIHCKGANDLVLARIELYEKCPSWRWRKKRRLASWVKDAAVEADYWWNRRRQRQGY